MCYINERNLKEKAKFWLEKIKDFNTHKMELQKDKSTLLVIDMQYFFLKEDSPTLVESGLVILPTIKNLINLFRKIKRPVIFTKHIHHPSLFDLGIMGWWWEGKCWEGTEESEIHYELAPLPSEKVVTKHRYSAFYNTDLEMVLRCLKIEDIVITGIMTNMCCESTARDTYFRDYRVFFLADATGTTNEEMHLASLLNLAYGFAYITSSEEIVNQLT